MSMTDDDVFAVSTYVNLDAHPFEGFPGTAAGTEPPSADLLQAGAPGAAGLTAAGAAHHAVPERLDHHSHISAIAQTDAGLFAQALPLGPPHHAHLHAHAAFATPAHIPRLLLPLIRENHVAGHAAGASDVAASFTLPAAAEHHTTQHATAALPMLHTDAGVTLPSRRGSIGVEADPDIALHGLLTGAGTDAAAPIAPYSTTRRAGSGRSSSVKSLSGSKAKPFVCTFGSCQRSFTRSGHLDTHMRTHTGMYECVAVFCICVLYVCVHAKPTQVPICSLFAYNELCVLLGHTLVSLWYLLTLPKTRAETCVSAVTPTPCTRTHLYTHCFV